MRYKVTTAKHNTSGAIVWAVFDAATTTQPIITIHGTKHEAEESARCLNLAGVVIVLNQTTERA